MTDTQDEAPDLNLAKARFDAAMAVVCFVTGAQPDRMLMKTRGAQNIAAIRQVLAYITQVEGEISRNITARMLNREETAFAVAVRKIEEDRERSGVDDTLCAMGNAVRDLAALRMSFVDPGKNSGRDKLMDALDVCGQALRQTQAAPIAPPTAADRARMAKEYEQATRALEGAMASLMDDPRLASIIGRSPGAAHVTRIDNAEVVKIKAQTKSTADDILARMKAVLAAASFRFLYAEVHQTGARNQYVAYAKVARSEPQPAATKKTRRA